MVKDARGIREEVYRAGTPDGKVPPGLYATYLKKANEYLEKARDVADPAQATVIADLIRFYQTGDPNDWLQFGGDWVQERRHRRLRQRLHRGLSRRARREGQLAELRHDHRQAGDRRRW